MKIENKELKNVKENWETLKQEYEDKINEVEIEKQDILDNAKREIYNATLKDLFENCDYFKRLYTVDYEMEERENKEMLKGLNNIYFDKVINPYKNSEKIIDLHTHTSYSGGSLQPDELINLAIEKRIKTLAITDINTIEGIKNINSDELIKDSQLEIINGIELQTTLNNRKVNILGYGIDLDNKLLNEKMSYLKNNRLYLILATLEQMKKDYEISFN